MLKLVFCCRRNPNLSVEDFQRSWLNDHGPLVRSLRKAFPQMRRYVQSHTLHAASAPIWQARGTKEPYDGITEVWIESLESLGVAPEEAIEAGQKLLKDEQRLLDLSQSAIFLTEEHEIFGFDDRIEP
jgi:hypothetical protein